MSSHHHIDIRNGDAWKQASIDVLVHGHASSDINKKTFSAAELQRQLGHKRYQPIWEMLHKLMSVMGQRDGEYKLNGTIELDEGYLTTEDPSEDEKPLKRGIGSQRKEKVLVMVESDTIRHQYADNHIS